MSGDPRGLVIVGGGPIGLTLALALAETVPGICVLESRTGSESALPQRTLALSHGSRLILERLQAWTPLQQSGPLSPIRAIEVSQRGAFGLTRLAAGEFGLPALGYVTSYAALQRALEQAARVAPISVEYGARATRLSVASDAALVEYSRAGATASLSARLVAVADGGGALLLAGKRRGHDYGQAALVAEVRSSVPAAGIAYERFCAEGPIALLPFGDGYTVIWTVTASRARELAAREDAAFLAELREQFGGMVGAFTDVANRRSFPLALEFARPRHRERIVAIGNAAQMLHPVAAQGFNLGLRDAFELALTVGLEPSGDALGSNEQLRHFAKRRRADRWGSIAFTHGLLSVFAPVHPAIAWPRGLALATLDAIRPLKQIFAGQMLYGPH